MDILNRITGSNPNGNRSRTNFLVVHHAAFRYPRGTAVERIRNYHSLRWPTYGDAGYHIIIQEDSDGRWRPYQTLKYDQIGAAVYGRNHESLHICLADDFTNQNANQEQLEVLADVLRQMQDKYPLARITSHRDIDIPGYTTACPARLRTQQWDHLLAEVSDIIDYQSLWGQRFPYIEHWGIPAYWRKYYDELGSCMSHEIYTSEYVIQHFQNGMVFYHSETGNVNHLLYEGLT